MLSHLDAPALLTNDRVRPARLAATGHRLSATPHFARAGLAQLTPPCRPWSRTRGSGGGGVEQKDRGLREEIEQLHTENYGVQGARQVHAEVLRREVVAARCTVGRLMRWGSTATRFCSRC
ncbi:IS3 family transposase [Georgenia muralis]